MTTSEIYNLSKNSSLLTVGLAIGSLGLGTYVGYVCGRQDATTVDFLTQTSQPVDYVDNVELHCGPNMTIALNGSAPAITRYVRSIDAVVDVEPRKYPMGGISHPLPYATVECKGEKTFTTLYVRAYNGYALETMPKK